MARIRTIKPETFTSETIAALSLAARWTFVGMWTYADDDGRAVDNAKIIRGALWPNDEDTISSRDVEAHLVELDNADMVCRYEHAGRKYLHVVNFAKHQRINRKTDSKLPPCWFHDLGGDVGGSGEVAEDSRSTHPQLTEPSSGKSGTEIDPSSDARLMKGEEIPPQETEPVALWEPAGQTGSSTPHPQLTEGSPPEVEVELGSGSGSGTTNPSSTPSKGRPAKPKPPDEHPRFAEFWNAYPRRVAVADARKAFAKTVAAGTDPDELIAAAARFRDHCQRTGRPKDKTRHAATWIHGESWRDDLEAEEAPQPRASPTGGHQPYRNPTDPNAYSGGLR